MSKFQIEAILEGVTPLKDGGVSLRFHTNEVSKAHKVELMEYYQSFGWLLFSANELKDTDIPKEKANNENGKSSSQRLRAVIFILWQQRGASGDFETYYKQQMEKVIDTIKSNLEDR